MENKALRYNKNKPKWSLVDFKSIEPMVKVLEYGKHKYSTYCKEGIEDTIITGANIPFNQRNEYKVLTSGKDNWKLGLDPTEILESLQRHLIKLFEGEEIDEESGLPHVGHLMCNAMMHQYAIKNKE